MGARVCAKAAARPRGWNSWRWQMAHAATAPEGAAALRVSERYPFFAVPYALELAAKCPEFALQTFPDARELADAATGQADPFSENGAASATPGMKHRYPDRVLVMASCACAMRCRHCTRKGLLPGAGTILEPGRLGRAVAWVRRHPAVRDVLVSGGDPLVLPDARVKEIVDAFAALPQIDIVRVCTRAPCTLPMRVTPALARMLARPRKVWVNTHFNCAGEITPEAAAACARLVDAGIPVSCQTVLMKGVNDTPEKMLALLRALTRIRVRPYYVFLCDPVAGVSHLRVSAAKARALEKTVAESIGGLSMPRFVADVPGARRKIPLSSPECAAALRERKFPL